MFVMRFKQSFLVFPSLQQKDEVYLNLVLDYVPETVYRVARHYSRAKQTLPMVYVKVYLTEFVCFFYLIVMTGTGAEEFAHFKTLTITHSHTQKGTF